MTKPFSRLWISSLTPDAIRRGFANLHPGTDYDRLADAASGRSRADWLVGMNLSRAYSIVYNEELSVGRVQTPTLAMIVDRELALRSFVPEDYLQVVAYFPGRRKAAEPYEGTWFRPADQEQAKSSRLPADGKEAEQIMARARTGQAAIETLSAETVRMQPPLLYDLTDCNGMPTAFTASAQRKRSTWPRRSMSSTSSSAIPGPTAVTFRPISRRRFPRS